MKTKHAAQIRDGIMAGRMEPFWGIYYMLTGKHSKLFRRAFVRTQRRQQPEASDA